MTSYIVDNLNELSQRHYVRKAGTNDYWFDYTQSKLQEYRTKFKDNFCLVLYASETDNDSYVIPYFHVNHLFKDEFIDDRRRWVGSISNNLLRIRRSNQTMSISAYYNAFEYLDDEIIDDFKILKEPETLYNIRDEIGANDLQQRIQVINETYKQIEPHKQKRFSEYIARPNAITDYLKKIRNYTCQICNQVGFMQKNGTRYIEAHHISELHKLAPGSLCSDNIVILCATCHRKLHYAHILYLTKGDKNIELEINGEYFNFEKNTIS